jgi:hypothetical protein
MKPKHWFAIGAALLLLAGAYALYHSSIFAAPDEFVQMSAIVLFGLGLIIILFAILAIVFSFLKLDDPRMALGLPDGSIRALLAFSLVLIFVCIATYLYNRIDKDDYQRCSKTLPLVTEAQLNDLKANFVVAAELARDKDGNLRYEQTPGPENTMQNDLKRPLYAVTYYPKPNLAATDFAKQIFTTLATIFVSVVSFYFGSSVTTSAVKAAQGADGGKLQTALTQALVGSHNAQAAVDLAKTKLQNAEADLKSSPDDQAKEDAVRRAKDELDIANKDLLDKQRKVQDTHQL